jgi:hypothetical protein
MICDCQQGMTLVDAKVLEAQILNQEMALQLIQVHMDVFGLECMAGESIHI